MAIQTAKRTILTAVGTWAKFEYACENWATSQQAAELHLARAVAFAFSHYQHGGDTKHDAINHVRSHIVVTSKDQARRLDNALTRITRSEVPEGKSIAQAAVSYGNEFVAEFYSLDSKLRQERKDAAQANREKKAKDEKKAAEETLKEIKAEAKKEAEAAVTVEVLEFTLHGENGAVEVLTPEEYMALAITLSDMRSGKAVVAEAA